MIDIEDIEKTREHYKLYLAIRMLDKNPKNIVARIIPEKPNLSFADIYHTLKLKIMFGKEVTKE